MTDKEKLDKLVAEIKRLRKEVKDNIAELGNSESERIGLFKDLEIYDNILSFIDSMQKEPKECMYSKDNYTDEDRKALCEGCEEECRFNKKEDSVSENYENALNSVAITFLQEQQIVPNFYADIIMKAVKRGANWQKEQLLAKAFDFTKEHNIACVLASECLRNHGWFSRERDFNDLFRHLSCVDKLFEGKFSGKTKVIVIKED